MSLVAYASSEEEEVEESDSAEEREEEEGSDEAEEEEEEEAGEGAAAGRQPQRLGRPPALFSALPPPKKAAAFPAAPALPPPASEPELPARPKKRRRRRRQPVRIAAPQLHSGESDSEEDEPAKKPPAAQAHGEGWGLSALLPQPKNLITKETNRTLLPYIFSRKAPDDSAGAKGAPASFSSASSLKPSLRSASAAVTTTPSPSAIKAAAKRSAMQVTKQIAQEENDSDEEVAPGNYFSLPERSEPSTLPLQTYSFAGSLVPDDLPPGTEPEGQEAGGPNAPLEFKTGTNSATQGWVPKPGENFNPPYPGYGDGGNTGPYYQQDYYSTGYYQPPALGPLPEVSTAAAAAAAAAAATDGASSSSTFFMDDEAFKRLQGKRNRGREEVTFVEIKGDDQLSSAQQWLTKSLTEEQTRKSFSKKKGEQPTGQQRRKHQITYLIHQAKERELELKNTWAENKLSRRQTQAKYGF